MANDPRFYLYPSATGPLRTITFPRGVSRVDIQPLPQVSDVYSGDQIGHRAFYGLRYSVFIGIEKYVGGDQQFERQIKNLESHLAAGGVVGFSLDHAKTWCAKLTGIPSVGSTVLHHGSGNGFSSWSSAAALAAADEVVVEGDYQSSYRTEYTRLTAHASHQSTLDDATWYDYPTAPVLRYRWFLPVLRQPAGATTALVTTDYRINYNVGIQLEYTPSATHVLFDGYSTGLTGGGGAVRAPAGALPLRGTDIGSVLGRYSVEERLVLGMHAVSSWRT